MSFDLEYAVLQKELSNIVGGKRPSEEVILLLKLIDHTILEWEHGNQITGNPATTFSEMGGVSILLNCMKALLKNGTQHIFQDERYSECYEIIRDLCWNASDRSLEFCDQCGECGMLSFLANELRNLKEKFEGDTTIFQKLVLEGFSILMNCSKSVNNIQILHDLDVVSLATEYIEIIQSRKIENFMDLEICCSILLVTIMDEDDFHRSGDMSNMIKYLVQILCITLSESDHSFSGFHADELMFALQKFAKNEENGIKVAEKLNEFQIFSLITKEGFSFMGEEKINILSLLCQLSFIAKLKKKITMDEEVMHFLRKSEWKHEEKRMAALTLFVLESQTTHIFDRSFSETSVVENRRNKLKKHVILCFEKKSRRLAIQIKSDLESKFPSCDVYLEGDDDQSLECLGENEMKIFQRSDASLLLLTQRYRNSLHCRAVTEFLTSFRKRQTLCLLENRSINFSGWIKSTSDTKGLIQSINLETEYGDNIKNQIYECLFGTSKNASESTKESNKNCTSTIEDRVKADVKLGEVLEHSGKKMSGPTKKAVSDSNKSQKVEKSKRIETQTNKKHIMISYQHSYQDIADQIRDLLKDSGYKVWMDMYDMKGDITVAMMNAIENSEFFIMCWSEKYEMSSVCRKEAEYAIGHLPRTRLIPLIVQEGYQPKSWIAFHFGSLFYYNIDNGYDVKIHSKVVQRLENEKQQL